MRIIQVAEGSAHSAEGLISLTTESRYELNLVHLYKLRAVGADGGRMNTPFNELIDHLRAQRVLQMADSPVLRERQVGKRAHGAQRWVA